MAVGNPLTRQRSPWVDVPNVPELELLWAEMGLAPRMLARRVHDGTLRVIVCDEPSGWHLSISHEFNNGNGGRYPGWDEISHARYELVPDEVDMVMHLPPPSEFVALHDTTFHLWESPAR